ITITSRDPPFVTPHIKSMLKDRNKCMRRGQIPKANALSTQINATIVKFNAGYLNASSDKFGGKQLWSAVKTVSVPKKASNTTVRSYASNLTATSLNNHFAPVSTD